MQLPGTKCIIRNKLNSLLNDLKALKYLKKLVLEFKKIKSNYKTKYSTFYSTSKVETIINESSMDDLFESIYSPIISNIQKYLGKCWVWLLSQL